MFKVSWRAPKSMKSMSGIISCLDKEVSLQNLASKSEQYAGNARRLLSVAPGCQWSNLPCVPFANRSSIRETESARVTFLFAAFKLVFLFRSMFLNLARYNGTGLERFIGKLRGGVYAYPRVERFCCRQ